MSCSDIQTYKKLDVLGYYKILNLSPNATASEIRKSYYTLALVYHPDKNKSPEAEAMFKAIVQAYNVLHDPDHRAEYDSLTYSYDKQFPETDLSSFFAGTILGNIFIYGASVGIIVCPLWGWILAPTLLVLIVAPILETRKCSKMAMLCCGIAIAPLTVAEIGFRISYSVLTGVAGLIQNRFAGVLPNSKPLRQLEDIEDGWVNMGEE